LDQDFLSVLSRFTLYISYLHTLLGADEVSRVEWELVIGMHHISYGLVFCECTLKGLQPYPFFLVLFLAGTDTVFV
jgi:hypothetical protein